MNTLQVVRRFVFSQWGGTESVVWNTSKQLFQLEHSTEILATKALAKEKQEIKDNIPIKRFPYFYPYLNLKRESKLELDKKGGDPFSFQLYKYMLKKENLHLIHCHSMNRMAAMVRLVAKKKKIPYLVSFHGGYFDVPKKEIEQMIIPYKKAINYGKFIDFIIKKKRYLEDADAIICIGNNEFELARSKFPQKLVYHLPNGVDWKKFQIQKNNSFIEKYNIPPHRNLILCVSRIDYQKNQEILLQLLMHINKDKPTAHLLLIGPVTSDSYFAKLQNTIQENRLDDQVTIIQGLDSDDPELVNAYNQADLFILPSVHEPFGIVVLEAWASGVPVITSQVGGLARLVKNWKNGLTYDNTLADLKEKYKKLTNNMNLQHKLTENAFQEVITHYSWRVITKKLLAYYREIRENYKNK
ncbi:MAG: glycosyltransferase family 4 protein [Candidatus Cloacimonadota bacterium]|nr:glycosyltransferase family 4 protein [Candidatus Cloacimonadota bacterium]